MGNPGADRFLNCVLNRNEHDIVIHVAVLALIIFGTPSYLLTVFIMYDAVGWNVTFSEYYSILLFLAILAVFVYHMIVGSMIKHQKRDIEWMESLTEYARCEGKDVQELEALRSKATGLIRHPYAYLCALPSEWGWPMSSSCCPMPPRSNSIRSLSTGPR